MARIMNYKKLYYKELNRRIECERYNRELRIKINRQADETGLWDWDKPDGTLREAAIAAYTAEKANKYAVLKCDDCWGDKLRLVLINKL